MFIQHFRDDDYLSVFRLLRITVHSIWILIASMPLSMHRFSPNLEHRKYILVLKLFMFWSRFGSPVTRWMSIFRRFHSSFVMQKKIQGILVLLGDSGSPNSSLVAQNHFLSGWAHCLHNTSSDVQKKKKGRMLYETLYWCWNLSGSEPVTA